MSIAQIPKPQITGRNALTEVHRERLRWEEQRFKEMDEERRVKRELEKMPRSPPINIPPQKLNF